MRITKETSKHLFNAKRTKSAIDIELTAENVTDYPDYPALINRTAVVRPTIIKHKSDGSDLQGNVIFGQIALALPGEAIVDHKFVIDALAGAADGAPLVIYIPDRSDGIIHINLYGAHAFLPPIPRG